MWMMATRSSYGFGGHEESLSSINFQTINTSSASEMGPYLGRSGGLLGMNMISSNANSGFVQNGYSSNYSLDSVAGGLKPADASLASEWSTEEQLKLEIGLEKYKEKPSIMKYIKIAATLPDKTVRDVALRCRWMTRKRRKAEELNYGKRLGYYKDKQVELTSSIPSVSPSSMVSYPFLMPSTTSELSGNAMSLLEQNVRAFSQIRANLSSYKAHDNIDLFYQARNNLISIQNDMNNMPGLMSQMPPFPVAIDDDLSATLLSNSTFAVPFNTMQNGSFHTKQEPFG